MTKDELKKFYKQDEKLYDLNENKKFLYMFNHLLDEGYDLFIGIDEMQDMIDTIFNWYEMKFPEREFDFYDGNADFSKFKELSDIMDMKQLFFRLTDRQQDFLEGFYRSKCEKSFPIYKQDEIVCQKKRVYYKIYRTENDAYYAKYKDFVVSADGETGLIDMDYELEKYADFKEIYIDELLMVFDEKYSNRLDFEEIRKAYNNRYVDNYLRDRLLEFVALRLIYSKKTTPERGYERARRFTNEFNKKLGLNLSMDNIDKVMNRDYNVDHSKVKKIEL